ncbi:MAG: Asp23/Gls24 family envelope stress response protein [Eubacterium sp.]|nr:Asp23/Gls24 family envelope stress response protein [Eubacterium sp.]
MADSKNLYTIYNDEKTGTAKITDEVLSSIAALAATEVDGVVSLGGNITADKIGKIRRKQIFRGAKVDVKDQRAGVRVIVNIQYGFNLPEVTKQVQERIKTTLENMTGLEVEDVHVSVAEVVL